MNGDKFLTVSYMMTLAMQHGMAWVGLDVLPANTKAATRNDLNNIGGFSGALMQTPADASVDEMVQGDLDTATVLGERFATFVATHMAGEEAAAF